MAKRDDLYRKFGPVLIEAIVLVTLEEVNRVRTALSLPPVTDDALMDAIEAKLTAAQKYSWPDAVGR